MIAVGSDVAEEMDSGLAIGSGVVEGVDKVVAVGSGVAEEMDTGVVVGPHAVSTTISKSVRSMDRLRERYIEVPPSLPSAVD